MGVNNKKSCPDIIFRKTMLEKLITTKRICPWWLCFTFNIPLRKILHDPVKILSPYVHAGDSVIDIGPGMGYFTIPLAKLVGSTGKVTAVDIQPRMLSALAARAEAKGVSANIKTHLANPASLGIHDEADFILAFWMLHEVPDQQKFFLEIRDLMKPEGLFLMAEPLMHVPVKSFLRTVETAIDNGFVIKERPSIGMSRSVLFTFSQNDSR